MKVYLNSHLYIFVIPMDVLKAAGKPLFLSLYYKKDDRIIALVPESQKTKDNFDIPEKIYSGKWKGLKFYGYDFGKTICRDQNWRYSNQQMEIQPTFTKERGIVLHLDQAVMSDDVIIGSEYLLPVSQYKDFWKDDE